MKLVLTCEHAFPEIPEEYKDLFLKDLEVLKTHEAYDPGAFDLFQELESLSDYSKYQEIGRLLVETNRSTHHPKLFSRFSGILASKIKQDILDIYYFPYRDSIEKRIRNYIEQGENVLHISVHSFTPVLNSIERNCDVGLLYHPQRSSEKLVCSKWKKMLLAYDPNISVRYNYPYLGKADGFTTYLRGKFPEGYTGIELEINQKWVLADQMDAQMKKIIFKSLQKLNN